MPDMTEQERAAFDKAVPELPVYSFKDKPCGLTLQRYFVAGWRAGVAYQKAQDADRLAQAQALLERCVHALNGFYLDFYNYHTVEGKQLLADIAAWKEGR